MIHIQHQQQNLLFENVSRYLDSNSKLQLKLCCRLFNSSIIVGDYQSTLYIICFRMCLFVFRLRIIDENISVVHSPKNRNIWISFHTSKTKFNLDDSKTIIIDRVTGFIYLQPENYIIGSLFQHNYFDCVDCKQKCFQNNIDVNTICQSTFSAEPFTSWFSKQPYRTRRRAFLLFDLSIIMRGHPDDWNHELYSNFYETIKKYFK